MGGLKTRSAGALRQRGSAVDHGVVNATVQSMIANQDRLRDKSPLFAH
jgi:hypothetical protein